MLPLLLLHQQQQRRQHSSAKSERLRLYILLYSAVSRIHQFKLAAIKFLKMFASKGCANPPSVFLNSCTRFLKYCLFVFYKMFCEGCTLIVLKKWLLIFVFMSNVRSNEQFLAVEAAFFSLSFYNKIYAVEPSWRLLKKCRKFKFLHFFSKQKKYFYKYHLSFSRYFFHQFS